MSETIKGRKENVERTLESARKALQYCVDQENEWNQKQKEAYETLVHAAKESEKNRLNKTKMQCEVEELEYELKELGYEEETESDD